MEEDELNDLKNNPNKPLSDILPDEFSFKTPREVDDQPEYSTASESQQTNHGYCCEATADSLYEDNQSS